MVGIKDFGMPSCCENCEMCSCNGYGEFYCDITLKIVDIEDESQRHADCPLIEDIVERSEYEKAVNLCSDYLEINRKLEYEKKKLNEANTNNLNENLKIASQYKDLRSRIDKAIEQIRNLDDINPDYPMDRTIHVSRNEVLEILKNIGE